MQTGREGDDVRRAVEAPGAGSMKLVVVGAAGRMGRTLVRVIAESPGLILAAAVERAGAPELGADAGELAGVGPNGIALGADARAAFAGADGVLDFTAPAATLAFAELASAAGIVHVIGTTGLSAADDARIQECAARARIVKSGNMSLGVNLLAVLVRQAARALDADFDIEILEMHHRHKVDAPSGTALLLGRAAAEGRGIALPEHSVRARDGHTGARRRNDIGFATLRGGSVIGEHSVYFAGEGEVVELAHRATDRAIFARGAVKAARWARGQAPGLYSMTDVLGLRD
jgi:4-hydroxy-tetrahydrodipicolinate reductase